MYKIENFSFTYPKDKKIIKDISFEIKKGDFLVITGKSGCGKTTLLRYLKPSLRPKGDIDGVIILDEEIENDDTKIGFVFQNPEDQLVMNTVWHEIAFGLENKGISLKQMKRRIGEIVNYFNLQSIINKETQSLSNGQKQLVALASVMVMNPKVILLDEATAQLDPVNREEFIKILKHINDDFNVTVVFVEHQLEGLLDVANRLIVMDEGKIVIDNEIKMAVDEMLTKKIFVESLPNYVRVSSLCDKLCLSIKEAREALVNFENFDIKIMDEIDNRILMKVRDLNFGHDDIVLRDLEIDILENEILSIVGANGSGKSSFLRCLAGLVDCQGEISKVGCVDRIGYLPQDPTTLFVADKVIDDLLLVDDVVASVESHLDNFGIIDLKDAHPFDLSSGQKQLVALAKILLTKPQLLLLDEPTKGIDASSKEFLANLIRGLSKHMTIVVASHDLEFVAKISDRVAMIFNGQMESVDSTREFFSHNLFYTTTINKIMRENNPEVILLEDLGL